jgi:hypothetical protein
MRRPSGALALAGVAVADPGTPDYHPPWTNAGMLGRIAGEFSGSEATPPTASSGASSPCGQPWTGFLAAVEVVITRVSPGGGGRFSATASATVCARFELHREAGPRRVTIREIDCPPSVPAPPTQT